MEFIIILIVIILIFIPINDAIKKEQQKKQEEEAQKRREMINRIFLHDVETEKEDNKYVNICEDEMLIGVDTFEEIRHTLKDTCDMVMDICREHSFQEYVLDIKTGNDEIDNSQKLFDSLKFFFAKDVFRNYERLGHKYYDKSSPTSKKKCFINYHTAEGQLLYCIVQEMMSIGQNKRTSWDNAKEGITGKYQYCQNLRSLTNEALNTFANAEVKATASNGIDDYEFCIILHNYNKQYENTYRKKMLRIATIIANADGKITTLEQQWIDSIANHDASTEISEDSKPTTENPYEELNRLVGLGSVKNEINTLCNYVIVKKKREEQGLKSSSISYHCVFTGNPGTGKTTVARLLGGIYRDLGVLKKGHLVETDRSGLVAEYVGQTAVKTNKIIDKALDGVLFIDEAYTLANGGTNDYGFEAIATLLKRMEDNRDRLVVILAGYGNEMETFIKSNPGLRSRFNRYIHFEDYTAEELYQIFCTLAKSGEYLLTDDASLYLRQQLEKVVNDKEQDFGNARYVRNLLEKAIETQSNRLASEAKLTKDKLTLLTIEDLLVDDSGLSKKTDHVPLNLEAYLDAKNQAGKDADEDSGNDITSCDEDIVIKPHSDPMNVETIEVSYSVWGFEDIGDTTFEMEIGKRDYEWMWDAEEGGEFLDSDYISQNCRALHKRILRGIRKDMEEEDYNDMRFTATNEDIEYSITL